jgi:hypothetical protein
MKAWIFNTLTTGSAPRSRFLTFISCCLAYQKDHFIDEYASMVMATRIGFSAFGGAGIFWYAQFFLRTSS